MAFKDKYSFKDEEGKVKITAEAFAVGEMLEKLFNILSKMARLK